MADWNGGRDRPILGCYLPVGDPAMPADLVALYRDGGVDLLEFGLPCDDPFLDGPVIEQAMARSIAAGFNATKLRERLERARSEFERGAIVVVSYGNFDLAPLRDEAGQWLFDACLDLSRVTVPREPARPQSGQGSDPPAAGFVSCDCAAAEVGAALDASLYVMLQATAGRTGGTAALGPHFERCIDRLRSAGVRVPILPGIGISTPALAAQAIRLGADGVIIGSRCVAEALRGEGALRALLGEVREAIDGER